MSNKTYKKIEIVGTSEESVSDAIKSGIMRVQETMRNVDWYEVIEIRGGMFGGKLTHQVTMKVGFRLEE